MTCGVQVWKSEAFKDKKYVRNTNDDGVNDAPSEITIAYAVDAACSTSEIILTWPKCHYKFSSWTSHV